MAYRVRDFTSESMAALQALSGIGTALNDRKKMELLAKEGAARLKESEQAQALNQLKIEAGKRDAAALKEQEQLIADTERRGALTPAAMEGTIGKSEFPMADGSAAPTGRVVDFQAIQRAKQDDAEAHSENLKRLKAFDSEARLHNTVFPDSMPLNGAALRKLHESKALETNRADQAQLEAKRQAGIKEKSDATKLSLDVKDAETRRMAAESGRFSPVTLEGYRLGVLNTKTGQLGRTEEKVQPKPGEGVVDGATAIPGLKPIAGIQITKDSVKAMKDAYAKYNDFTTQLGEYKALINKYGAEAVGEHADELDAYSTGLAMTLKELQNLGVLNGPDLALLQKQIPGASGLLAKGKSLAYGAAGEDPFTPRLNTLESSVSSKFNSMARANGFQLAANGGDKSPGSAPEVGATKKNSHGDTIRWNGQGWEIAQ